MINRRLAVCLSFLASVAVASEQSERLHARGILELNAQRYGAALELFEQALQADSQDVSARYYRGLARSRSGDAAGALSDLREVVAAQPDNAGAALAYGIVLLESGAAKEAVPLLTKAQGDAELAAQASLFLGVARLRLDDPAAARGDLERAQGDASVRAAATYYLGVVDYREGKLAEAEVAFQSVAESSQGLELGTEAAAFLARIRGATTAAPRRRYQVFGAVGFLYDSNVVLAPANEALKTANGITEQADGAATLEVGGHVAAVQSEHVDLTLGYDFYQSLYFDLDRFNIQDHRPSAQVVWRQGPLQLGLLGQYDYYFLRADSFLQDGTALPFLTVQSGDKGRTEVFYRFRRRDFLKQPFNGLRDAINHSTGIQQYIYLGAAQRYLTLGYRFDREDPTNSAGDAFGYDGNEVVVGGGWDLPLQVTVTADGAYRHEAYDRASSSDLSGDIGSQRRDDEYQAVFALHRDLWEHLRISATYYGTWNHSNKKSFEYDRHVGAVTVEARF